MKYIILVVYLLRAFLSVEPVRELEGDSYLVEVKEEDYEPEISFPYVRGTVFQTVKKYYCRADIHTDQELLVYGTKSWTFSSQDVNLTLQYPSAQEPYDGQEDVEYILTELEVIFHLAGSDSRGYITSGGMYQDNIRMTFVFSNITSLAYQFSLYGVPKRIGNLTENYTIVFNLC